MTFLIVGFKVNCRALIFKCIFWVDESFWIDMELWITFNPNFYKVPIVYKRNFFRIGG